MAQITPKILPKIIKPYNFAKQNLEFSARYKLFDLPRLAKILTKNSNLELNLKFSLKDNLNFATGNLIFDVFLPCVNCLELIKFDFNYELNLVFGNVDNKIPSNFELIEITDNFTEIDTLDFISEEILLKLPEFPKHDYKCIDLSQDKQKNNKFAELKDLIK